jgi:hypothetical protein
VVFGRIFCGFTAKNRAIRSNSSQTAPRFAPVFPLLSLARASLGASMEYILVMAGIVFFFLTGKNDKNSLFYIQPIRSYFTTHFMELA